VRVAEAEARLLGSALDTQAVHAAAALLAEACDPVDDVRGSTEYRLMLVPRLVARAIAAARAKAEDAS
jgi:carbon-monoxide dehydrogenase medium subunit